MSFLPSINVKTTPKDWDAFIRNPVTFWVVVCFISAIIGLVSFFLFRLDKTEDKYYTEGIRTGTNDTKEKMFASSDSIIILQRNQYDLEKRILLLVSDSQNFAKRLADCAYNNKEAIIKLEDKQPLIKKNPLSTIIENYKLELAKEHARSQEFERKFELVSDENLIIRNQARVEKLKRDSITDALERKIDRLQYLKAGEQEKTRKDIEYLLANLRNQAFDPEIGFFSQKTTSNNSPCGSKNLKIQVSLNKFKITWKVIPNECQDSFFVIRIVDRITKKPLVERTKIDSTEFEIGKNIHKQMKGDYVVIIQSFNYPEKQFKRIIHKVFDGICFSDEY